MTDVSVAALRPLGAGEILDGAVRSVRRSARAAFTIALPYAIVRTVAIALIDLASYDSADATAIQLLGLVLVSTTLGVVLTGFLTPTFADEFLGRRLTVTSTLARVRGTVPALVALAVVVGVVEEAGLLLLVVGGVWLWGLWAVAAPALVTERTGLRGALRRSLTLVRGDFWRTFWVRLLGVLVTTVMSVLLTLPFDALAAYVVGTDPLRQTTAGLNDPQLYVLIASVGALLAALVTGPVSAAVDVLLYLDLRMRREGMDLVLTLPPLPADAMVGPAGSGGRAVGPW